MTPVTDAALLASDPLPAMFDHPAARRDETLLIEPNPNAPSVATITLIADPGWWSQDLAQYLGSEGFTVVLDPDGASAFDHRIRTGDAVIVDLRLAACSAPAVCVAWRRRTVAPILAIAESRDERTVLAAFAAGADHVVMKDVTSRQVVAHLRSLLRQVPPRRATLEATSAVGPVRLDEDGRGAHVGERMVQLTDEEFRLLALLLDRGGRVVTRSELAHIVAYASGSARAVDFFVRRLREKLEEVDTCRRIVVVRGVGFRFDVAGEQGAGDERFR